jgi:hypothetical protein
MSTTLEIHARTCSLGPVDVINAPLPVETVPGCPQQKEKLRMKNRPSENLRRLKMEVLSLRKDL